MSRRKLRNAAALTPASRPAAADRDVSSALGTALFTVRDVTDAMDAVDAWGDASLNRWRRVMERLGRQDSSAEFLMALTWVTSQTIELLDAEKAAEWRLFIRQQMDAADPAEGVIP